MLAFGIASLWLGFWACPHCSKLFHNFFVSLPARGCANCGLPRYSLNPAEARVAIDEEARSAIDLEAEGRSPSDALAASVDGVERSLGRMCDSLEGGVAPRELAESEVFGDARRHVTSLLNNPRTLALGLDGAAAALDSLLARIIQASDEVTPRRQVGAAYLLGAALSDVVSGRPFLEEHHRLGASELFRDPALADARTVLSLPALVRVASRAVGPRG